MNKLAALLLASLILSACADDEEPIRYTCTASIVPFEYSYEMLSNDLVEVSIAGETTTFVRLGNGGGPLPIHGTWYIGQDNSSDDFVSTLAMRVEQDRVAAIADCDFGSFSLDASAISSATVTDSIIRAYEEISTEEAIIR